MAKLTVNFEHLVPSSGWEDIADGYKGFADWYAGVMGKSYAQTNYGPTGPATAINGKGVGFTYGHSGDTSYTEAYLIRGSEFALKYMTMATFASPGHVIILGYSGGSVVATKDVVLDNDTATIVKFGKAFAHIDAIQITTDPALGGKGGDDDFVSFDDIRLRLPDAREPASHGVDATAVNVALTAHQFHAPLSTECFF